MHSIQKEYITIIKKYIVQNVVKLLKQPRAFIKHPYIDPGSVYEGNLWDWDSYWTVYGLLSMMEDFPKDIQEKIIVHSKGNIYNFLEHQLEDGYIPMMIEVAEWPEPYLNIQHKKGVLMNMHKPFLCQQINIISEYINDYNWIHQYMPQIDKYISYYFDTYYKKDKELFVWCDDIMIGMDNDPCSFGRPKFSTANIFLNSFMIQELKAYEKLFLLTNRGDSETNSIKKKIDDLIHAIQTECWDERDQFYYSVDVDIKTRKYDWFHQGLGVFWNTLPIRIKTWSGFLPMLAKFATKEQAAALVCHYRDDKTFHTDYGVVTLAKNEKMFNCEATNNPSNWLGPIWLIANYAVFRGLLNYEYKTEAKEIYSNSIRLLAEDLKRTGCMHEYYNPMTGKPVMNGGFINWNILVVAMEKELKCHDNI